ncbi:phage baseplate assembly protein V [Desulfocurvibacter africanus]|uniref:phage baseplate assembly protein V n=1 Tax=Desulfocurvibacter africanus TaxID=873 RepID=UPI000485D82C|nr:phage baseplate assembly protein V [Desulfocurvibacter africanus]
MRALGKVLGPIKRRISLLVTRCVVSLVDSNQAMQLLQVKLLADELLDDAEHFEAYGFTSCPHPGAEGVALAAGGNRSHCIVVCVGDRRYRLTGLKAGEVAIYSDEGDSIVLRRGRKIEVTAGTQVSVTAPKAVFSGIVECAQLVASGAVSGQSVSDAAGDMAEMRSIFNAHKHPSGTPTTGTPTTPME